MRLKKAPFLMKMMRDSSDGDINGKVIFCRSRASNVRKIFDTFFTHETNCFLSSPLLPISVNRIDINN